MSEISSTTSGTPSLPAKGDDQPEPVLVPLGTAAVDRAAAVGFGKTDLNHDKKLSQAEWTAAGRSAADYQQADTNGRGGVSLGEFAKYLSGKGGGAADATTSPGIAVVDSGRHGTAVSSIAEASSASGPRNVRYFEAKMLSATQVDDADVIAKLQQIAQSRPLPAVVNLSLGDSAANFFQQALEPFRKEFIRQHGKPDTWDAGTLKQYKSAVEDLSQKAVKDFERYDKQYGQAMRSAIKDLVEKGVTVVVAAGNEAGGFQAMKDLGIVPPAGFDKRFMYNDRSLPGVIVVGASKNDQPIPGRDSAPFTRPDQAVDVAADGIDYRGFFSGTSAAAPQVAGMVADMVAANPRLQPADVEAILKQSATPVPGEQNTLGAGIINRERALALAASWGAG